MWLDSKNRKRIEIKSNLERKKKENGKVEMKKKRKKMQKNTSNS